MFRRVGVALALTLSLVSIGAVAIGSAWGAQRASTTITFTAWGGTSQDAETEAWLKPFMASHPTIKIKQDSPNDYAKIKAMVEAKHVTWDVVHVGNDFALSRDSTKLLERIDCKRVECASLQPKRLLTTGYRAPLTILSVVLGYNKTALNGATPRNWADFFDTEVPRQARNVEVVGQRNH